MMFNANDWHECYCCRQLFSQVFACSCCKHVYYRSKVINFSSSFIIIIIHHYTNVGMSESSLEDTQEPLCLND